VSKHGVHKGRKLGVTSQPPLKWGLKTEREMRNRKREKSTGEWNGLEKKLLLGGIQNTGPSTEGLPLNGVQGSWSYIKGIVWSKKPEHSRRD